MATLPLVRALSAALLLGLGAPLPALADATGHGTYVISLGGTILASASFRFADTGGAYTLDLNANVTGVAQLVAAGTAKADSSGSVTAGGLKASTFDLVTHSGGEQFAVQVQYAAGGVSAFVVTPPIVNNINRVPLERSQLNGVNDFMASFVLKGAKLDRSLCNEDAHVFTGIERFDLDFAFAKSDVATSPRTGYQGPVIACKVSYKPISGHYTTSALTNSLAGDDRILVWFAPLHDSGYFIPYRVLLTTSMGDLSMVLTSLD